jgi:iron complex outermembrane receptor protein
MNPKSSSHLALWLLIALVARAQPAKPQADGAKDQKDDPVVLPSFEIRSDADASFVGKSALSSTRIAVDLPDLPQSVKVLNQSFLQAINPIVLTETLNYVGGAQMGNQVISPGRVTIRGFAGDGDYIDGFAPPANSAPESALFDRFEVIKGPSVIFLAADGSPGGIVNKITKAPRAKRETTLALQIGRFDANNISLDTTGPVTRDGKLLYRLVAAQQYSNGYYDYSWLHRLTVMPALSYQFSPTTKLEIKGLLHQAPNGVYQGIPIDPRTLQPFNIPATRNPAEDAPFNWRHDLQKRGWFNFTSRISEFMAFHLAGMAASATHTRVVSAVAPWTEARSVWAIANYNGTQSFPRSTNADYTGSIYRDLQSDVNFNFGSGPINHNLLIGGKCGRARRM